MIFQSSILGEVEVKEDEIIDFPDGLPGLEHCTKFKLFHDEKVEHPRVFWMQSLDDKDVLLNLVDAFDLKANYHLKLTDDQIKKLRADSPDDISIKILIYRSGEEEGSKAENIARIQANMRAPLLINLRQRRGLQLFDLNCEVIFKSSE